MNKVEERPTSFSVKELRSSSYDVATISGFRVNILSTDYKDDIYKVCGHIGNSTRLETWTTSGKYYHKEKRKERFSNQNNLILIKKD